MKNNKKKVQKLFKAALATSVATGAMVAVAPFNTEAAGFSDLKPTHVHYNSILNLTERGIIKGFTDGTFKPEDSVTRGQAAKIIALTLGLDTKKVTNPGFKDVKTTDEYYAPIAALVKEGIISGKEDGTYRPYEKLKRSQMAKIIALAFDFEEETLTDKRFTDVKSGDWFNGYVQSLLTNEITTGTTKSTFSPYEFVKRGQLASFVVRAEAAAKAETVVSVTNDSIVLSSGTYTIAENLKKVFNTTNAAALKDAKVKFTTNNGQITAVQSLEITADGTAATNLVLDGADATFAGNLNVTGDYVTVKNLTVNGNLLVGKEVENSFQADKLTVKGTTEVANKTAGLSVAALPVGTAITFNNSTLATVTVAKANASLGFKGNTVVPVINVNANATITADTGITLPKLNVTQGASQVTINAKVTNLTVLTPQSLTLDGASTIATLTVTSPAATLTLGANTQVVNLDLPAGQDPEDIIDNYDDVKDQIGDVTPTPTPGPTPGPTPPPPVDYTTGNNLLHSTFRSELAAGNTNSGNKVEITYPESGNRFVITIKDNSTVGDFYDEANTAFDEFKNLNTVVNSARVSYTTSDGVNMGIDIESDSNNLSFSEVIQKAFNRVGFTSDTPLTVLDNRTIRLSVNGSINSNPFNDSYSFEFKLQSN